jgi:TonB family protein
MPHRFDLEDGALAVLVGGMFLRAGWFGLGLLRLRRYRRHARRLAPVPSAVERVQRQLGIYPQMALSDEITGPVTFGVRNPIVLFPAKFPNLDASVQEALASHELLHVRRRDWLFTVIEELIRALFWFHPAVWWLLGQIQLAREQAVDGAVIAHTVARQQYVDALLTLSGARQQLDLMPAPLFLRRRHLTRRVAAIVKETEMSKRRLYTSLAASLGGLVLIVWLVAASLPLSASPQTVADSPGVTVSGADRLIHRAPVEYPKEASEKGIEGTVMLQVQVAASGTVSDASVESGPMELRKPALASVLQWHFMKDAAGRQQVSVAFKLPAPGQPAAVQPPPPPAAVKMEGTPPVIKGVVFQGVEPAAAEELRRLLPSVEGQTPSATIINNQRSVIREFDEHLTLSFVPTEGGLNLVVRPAKLEPSVQPQPTEPPVQPQLAGPSIPQRIRVGGNVQRAMLTHQAMPVYPPEAKQAGVSGTVRMSVVIGRDGKVISLTLESGDPLLAPAAMEAVKQWEYRPTLLNGNPVEVVTTVDVNYTLAR